MIKDINIRKAKYADITTLLQFEQGIISAERPFDNTLGDDPLAYYDLPGLIASEDVALVVAMKEEVVIGSGYARIEESKPYNRHRLHAYLGFMYVVPEYRGLGINRMILHELANWALSKKVIELRLDVYEQNASAIHAYEKAGFIKHMVAMRADVHTIAGTQP